MVAFGAVDAVVIWGTRGRLGYAEARGAPLTAAASPVVP